MIHFNNYLFLILDMSEQNRIFYSRVIEKLKLVCPHLLYMDVPHLTVVVVLAKTTLFLSSLIPLSAFMFIRSAATVFLPPFSTSMLSEPLAGAFNRRWHLSPRAVMYLIHQQGMTGCMPSTCTCTFVDVGR